jgi:hypothetical protein
MLREAGLHLPRTGRGRIVFSASASASASRAGRAWTDKGTARQERGLKRRAANETRRLRWSAHRDGDRTFKLVMRIR